MRSMSAAQFLGHLGVMAAEVEHATRRALERAAVVVEREAKAEIGHYQDEAGPFASWAELADATKEDRLRLGYSENDPGLRSGEMRDSIGHTVEMSGPAEGVAHVGSSDDKMVWFENGTAKQPPRSVLGGSLVRKADEVVAICGRGVVGALVGEDVDMALIGR